MNNHLALLRSFLDGINNLSFFDRIFKWGKTKKELVAASASLAMLQNELSNAEQKLAGNHLELSVLLENKRTAAQHLQALQNDISTYRERIINNDRETQMVREENIQLKKEEEFRSKKYSDEITSLQSIKQSLQDDRAKEVQQKHEEELARLKAMKETWTAHQSDVQSRIKSICQKHTLTYVDKPAFRGEPDNTLFICNEHVIFDAKSPAGDNLKNFPVYIKTQTEAAKKVC